MNRKVNILGKSFYSPSLKNVAGLESVTLNIPYKTTSSIDGKKYRQMYGKLKT